MREPRSLRPKALSGASNPVARAAKIAILVAMVFGSTSMRPVQADDDRVTLEAERISLADALQLIMRNRDVSMVTGEVLDELISVRLRDVPWRQALESLLRTHGYRVVDEQGILRVIRPTNASAETSKRIPLLIRPQHVPARSMRPLIQPLMTEKGQIVLMEDGITPFGALSILDEPQVIDLIRSVLPNLDRAAPLSQSKITRREGDRVDIELVNFPVDEIDRLLRKELGLNVLLRQSVGGYLNVTLDNVDWREALKQILAEHQLAYQETSDVFIIDDLAKFSATLITRDFFLQYANGWDVKPYIESMLSPEGKISCYSPSPRGGFQVGGAINEVRQERTETEERRSKIISVTDHPEVLATIEDKIRSLDTAPKQVEVSVKIIKITREKQKQRGIDWDTILSLSGAIRPTTLPFENLRGFGLPSEFPDPGPEDFTFGSLDASELRAVLRLIDQNNDAEILSEPNLTTLDNIKASILIGQKFPVTTETIDPQTAVRTVTLDYYEDIGIQLLVFPSISDEDRIHLTIHPAVSTLAGLVEDRFPIIETRETDTQVLLRSGETVVIGGLVEQTTSKTRKEIPGLGQIPLFGRLFSYHQDVELTSELVILVTPRIVLTPEELRQTLLLPRDDLDRLRVNQSILEGLFER